MVNRLELTVKEYECDEYRGGTIFKENDDALINVNIHREVSLNDRENHTLDKTVVYKRKDIPNIDRKDR